MSKKMHEIAIFLLFLLQFSVVIRGDIDTINITTDSRDMIVFSKFAFTKMGHLSISVSSIVVTPPNDTTPINSSRFGFFVTHAVGEFQTKCILDDPDNTMVFTFADLPPPPQSSLSKSINITNPDYYDVFFGNCNPPKTNVSMLVHVEAYNLDAQGRKNYLSDGETQLIPIFSFFSASYILFFIVWICTCIARKSVVKKIHFLMLALLFVKALNLVFALEEKYHINVTGSPHGWDSWFYVVQAIKGLLLTVVIILIGTGWSFLKPFLQERDKKILLVGIPLQVFVNVAQYMGVEGKVSDDGHMFNSINWTMGFGCANIICAVVIMVPIVWSMDSIVEAAKEDGKAAANLKKMRIFRDFYLTALAYLFFNDYIMFLWKDNNELLDLMNLWVPYLISEIVTLLFYIMMFYLFRPLEDNPYLALPSDENADAQEVALAEIKDLQIFI